MSLWRVLLALGCALTVAIVVAWLQPPDWQTAWQSLRRLGGLFWLFLGALNAALLALGGLRLRCFVRGSVATLAAHRLAAMALSFVTPGPHVGGEPALVLLLRGGRATSLGSLITAVLWERSSELVTNGVLLAALVLALPSADFAFGDGSVSALGAGPWLRQGAVGVLVLAFAAFAWGITHRGVIGEARRVWAVGAAVGITALVWVLAVGEYVIVARGVGLTLPLVTLLSAFALARIALLAPVPGAAGVLEATQFVALSGQGAPTGMIIGLCAVLRLRDLAVVALGLGWGMYAACSGEFFCFYRMRSLLPFFKGERGSHFLRHAEANMGTNEDEYGLMPGEPAEVKPPEDNWDTVQHMAALHEDVKKQRYESGLKTLVFAGLVIGGVLVVVVSLLA